MDTLKKQRQQLAKAIIELHELYISTGEEKKPMTISLPDLAGMAGLDRDVTENILILFIGEKLIHVENSAILIVDKKALKKIA
ncbi:winged helix-turn-helix domain-containing protein [Cytophaga aurantiaca]|uniref:winged helix-turn-helix domain-containing protein n=1 Tax=Cytophaga aurantiaca TaxID=29530 RepID=UPI000381DD6C|nr:winged helix-turn-helix domain-containing protein [Cytophaga aurantiaca]